MLIYRDYIYIYIKKILGFFVWTEWACGCWPSMPAHQWLYPFQAQPIMDSASTCLSAILSRREFLSSFYYSRVPGSVTCSCVPEGHRKYHPMGDDTALASASSGQDSALKWNQCVCY